MNTIQNKGYHADEMGTAPPFVLAEKTWHEKDRVSEGWMYVKEGTEIGQWVDYISKHISIIPNMFQ